MNHPQTAKSAHNFGWTLLRLGRYDEAGQYLQKAVEIKSRFFGDDSPELLPTLEVQVTLAVSQRQIVKAKNLLRQLIHLVDDKPARFRVCKSAYLCRLAELEENTGNLIQAEALYWESVTFQEGNFGNRHINTPRAIARLGDFYKRHENFQKAEYFLNRSRKLLRRHLPRNHPDLQQIKSALDEIYQHF